MDLLFQVEVAIGNGRAIAMACASAGARTVVADRDLDSAELTASEIRRRGGEATAVRCDVLSDDDCRAVVAMALDTYGGLQLLVNNVGVGDVAPIDDTPVAHFDASVAVNVRGHFLSIKHALPALIASGGGSIVTIASINAVRHGAGVGYETSKAALLGLTRNVAATSARFGVRANTVLPGVIDSPMLRKAVGDRDIDFTGRIPLGRLGSPWDVAKAAVFLLSDDASFVTGAELVVDGGMTVLM